MTDITELAQSWKTAAHKAKQANDLYLEGKITLSECVVETKDYLDYSDNPNNFLALVEALEKARQRIAELENNEIQEEGNQFLVVRHPGKVPVIKHPVGDLEDYLWQIFKADPLATIDIVTHRYYGVGGQFVEDADEYLHEMSIKVEAE